MGYRVLFLANPVKLSVKNEQLMIDNGEITRFPLEDIECIVCDTPQLNITARLLIKFAEYAITFYITDSGRHPSGVFLPVSRHSRHASVLQDQIAMSLPAKKEALETNSNPKNRKPSYCSQNVRHRGFPNFSWYGIIIVHKRIFEQGF